MRWKIFVIQRTMMGLELNKLFCLMTPCYQNEGGIHLIKGVFLV